MIKKHKVWNTIQATTDDLAHCTKCGWLINLNEPFSYTRTGMNQSNWYHDWCYEVKQ